MSGNAQAFAFDRQMRAYADDLKQVLATLAKGHSVKRSTQRIVVAGVNTEFDASRVAWGLALTSAGSGFRVLLVDANLHRPAAHTQFGVSNDFGLTDLLFGSEAPHRFPQSTPVPNLAVITAGPKLSVYAGLLSREQLFHRLQPLAKYFDYIIVDAARLTPALVGRVSEGADNVIVTAKQHGSSMRELANSGSNIARRGRARGVRPNARVMRFHPGARDMPAARSGRVAAHIQHDADVQPLTRDLIRYHERSGKTVLNQWAWAIVPILIGAVCYNGLLALLNAHVMSVGRNDVVLAEMLLLSAAAFVVAISGPRLGDGAPVAFFAFFLIDMLVVSMLNNDVLADMGRDAAIIAVFVMVGARVDTAHVNRCFTIAAVIVAAVLLLEMISTPAYAAWFAPGDYFAKTRGISKRSSTSLACLRTRSASTAGLRS